MRDACAGPGAHPAAPLKDKAMATFLTPPRKRVPRARSRRPLVGGFWRWLHGFYQTGRIEPAGERRPASSGCVRRARASR